MNDQPTHLPTAVAAEYCCVSIGTMFKTICIIFAVGGMIFLSISANEFYKISVYEEAQCFILSAVVNTNYSVGSYREVLLYRAVWKTILYDSDGTNSTTFIWSSISKPGLAHGVCGMIAKYQVNQTYKCYPKRSSIHPGQIEFDKPLKSVAIDHLIYSILLISFSVIIIFLYKKYNRSMNEGQRRTTATPAQCDPLLSSNMVTPREQATEVIRGDNLSPPITHPRTCNEVTS